MPLVRLGTALGSLAGGAGVEPLATIATKTKTAIAGHSGNEAAQRTHPADTMIALISNEEVPSTIQGYPRGTGQARTRRWPPITTEALGAIARHGGDEATQRIHPADTKVGHDEEIPSAVQGYRMGKFQACTRRRPPVATEAFGAIARHGGDEATQRIHPVDTKVDRIRNKEIPSAIYGHPRGIGQARTPRWPPSNSRCSPCYLLLSACGPIDERSTPRFGSGGMLSALRNSKIRPGNREQGVSQTQPSLD